MSLEELKKGIEECFEKDKKDRKEGEILLFELGGEDNLIISELIIIDLFVYAYERFNSYEGLKTPTGKVRRVLENYGLI